MAVTAARHTHRRPGKKYNLTVETGETIYEGSLCALNASGNLVAVTNVTTNVGGFIALEGVVSAAAGALLDVESRVVAKLGNGDSITKAHIGDTAYGFDNATVKRVATGLSAVGQIEDVDSDGVWVLLEPIHVSGLAAANNLSDVGTVATARVNLGVDRQIVQLVSDLDLIGANTAQFRYVHVGPDCTVTRLSSVINKALTTGNATITADIGGTPITGGVITVTQAGSAEDDVDAANPSAANTITEGDVMTLTVGGTNDAAASTASISMELTFA